MRWPLTKVPFVLFRSSMTKAPPALTIRAWRAEVCGSLTTMSQAGSRPMTVILSRSGKVRFPETSSKTAMTRFLGECGERGCVSAPSPRRSVLLGSRWPGERLDGVFPTVKDLTDTVQADEIEHGSGRFGDVAQLQVA